jgi:TolB-like protein
VNPKTFFAELKRRNVYKVAIAYGVVAWLLMQIASQIFPFFEIPNWAVRLVVLLLIIGFPVALILAWAFELTPEGIKRAEDVDLSPTLTRKTGRKLDFLIIAVLLLVISILLFQRLHPTVSPAVSSSLDKSIAVLPFENFSEDKAFAFFADGVQDEILTDLAKIADLKVISRTSVMQYKSGSPRNLPEIAQALKVAHVLEGSVQRSGNRVRVSAQLIDARNDTHVWVEKYDRDLADVFAIQSEIAQKIADQLQAKLSPQEKSAISQRPTSDLAAYDLYLRAKQLFYDGVANPSHQREYFFKVVQLLDQAVARDAAFLLAHCQLAFIHDYIYFDNYDPTKTRLALAETCVRAAVRLQPDSGETHLAQAIHFYWGYRDFDRAREQLTKAQHALPNNAQIFQFLGLIDRRQSRRTKLLGILNAQWIWTREIRTCSTI